MIAVIHVGVAAFIMRSEDALQLPFARLLYGDLSPVANGTRFGQAFIAMTLGFTWVAGAALPRVADEEARAAVGRPSG